MEGWKRVRGDKRLAPKTITALLETRVSTGKTAGK
jgi:hypothetical protein